NINIPSINSTHFGFEILDTPGVNNANNISHQKLAYDNIRDNETNPIIAFIINANSYISTDQDELFSAINDTLKDKDIVNTERFFFIVNRADEIKAKEFEKLSKNIEKYLKDKFSSDVKIFYTNSYYATLINKKLNNIELDDEEKYELKQYIGKTKILKFLPEYSSISKYTKQSIEEFKYIKDEDSKEDKLKKALYYTGIPVVELAIQKYIDNYAVIHKFQYAFENIEKYISDYKYKLKDKIKKKDKLLGELSDLSDNTSSNEVKLETIKNSIDLIKKQIVQSDNDIKAIDKYINKLEPEINKFKEKIKNLTLNTKELDDINRKWADTISKQNKKSDNIKNLNSIAHELSHRGVSSKTAAQHGVRNQFRKEAATIVNDFKNILDSHKHGLGNLKEEFDNDINVKGLDEKKLVFNASKDDLKKKRDNDKIDYFSLGISKLFRDKEIINKDEILKLDIELRKELEAIKKESNKELNDLKTNTKKEIDKLIVHIKNKKTEKMNDSKKLEKKKEELGNCINNQENISSNNERLKKVIKGIYDELSSIDTVINNIDNYIVRLDSLVKLKDYHEKN
ncbi:MAG: hypothetical protein U9N59_08360, partial [Campylobacterota bacterium]|nr:hypothetical protein [Campylobacterota bacterium]